jgi:hypothetical protein
MGVELKAGQAFQRSPLLQVPLPMLKRTGLLLPKSQREAEIALWPLCGQGSLLWPGDFHVACALLASCSVRVQMPPWLCPSMHTLTGREQRTPKVSWSPTVGTVGCGCFLTPRAEITPVVPTSWLVGTWRSLLALWKTAGLFLPKKKTMTTG